MHHRSVRSAGRKVVISLRSPSLLLLGLVARAPLLIPWLGYSLPRPCPLTLVMAPLSLWLTASWAPSVPSATRLTASPAPWSPVTPYTRSPLSGIDPGISLTGYGIGGFSYYRSGFWLFGRGVCSLWGFFCFLLLCSAPGRLVLVLDQGSATRFPPL